MYSYFFLQIIRFNSKSYWSALFVIVILTSVLLYLPLSDVLTVLVLATILFTTYFTTASILFSWYIYDRSDLYTFTWLQKYLNFEDSLWNVYSGYSEAGHLLVKKMPLTKITHLNFFDLDISVTNSIRIAEKWSTPLPGIAIQHQEWKLMQKATHCLFMQSLHELRTAKQQIDCLQQALQYTEQYILVVEHLRDLSNMSIYAHGTFHFYSRNHWIEIFEKSGLVIEHEFKITPFVHSFVLTKK